MTTFLVVATLVALACAFVVIRLYRRILEQQRIESVLRADHTTLEHQLRKHEADTARVTELYQRLAESATEMVSTHRPDGSFDSATPSWVEYTGLDLVGTMPTAIAHPDDIELLLTHHWLGFRSPELVTTVWRCRRRDGTYGWLETRCRSVRDAATNRVDTFICATRDVTEQRRRETEFEWLHRIVLAVSAAPSLAGALEITLRELCEATGWSYGEAWLPSEDGTVIERSSVWYGREGADVAALAEASAHLAQKPGEGIPGSAWQLGRIVWVRDVRTDPRVTRCAPVLKAGLNAGIAVPVVADGVVVAVLTFIMKDGAAADDAHVAFVSVVATQLAALIAGLHATQALANERLFLEALVDSLSEGIIAVDATGKVRLTNRATRETHGDVDINVTFEHVPRRYKLFNLDGLTHLKRDDLPLVRALRGNDVRGQEYILGTVSGEMRTMSANGRPIVDQAGKRLGAVMATRDITQTKRDEVALRQSESRYRQLVEQAADAILLVGPDGRCAAANTRAGLLTGVRPDDLIGREIPSFMIPISAHESLATLASSGGINTAEFRIHRIDGAVVPVEASAAALADGHVQIIARDISSRKELDRLKDEFVSVVSHELRTPLTAIRGSLGLLASGRLAQSAEQQQRMLDVAVHSTDRLIRLINDILDVERIDSGAVPLNLAWCDGHTLANAVVDALRAMGERGRITLTVSGAAAPLWADADRITQTLMNLVGNAIKFSPPGATVEILVDSGHDAALIQVRDSGRGIPADKLDIIFRRFQQVDGSDAREKGGTGLGLAISRGIIRQHGGRIWAENNVAGGSTFTFTLPHPPAAEPRPSSYRSWQRTNDSRSPS